VREHTGYGLAVTPRRQQVQGGGGR
jgi:hypothetical protein